MGVLSFAMGLLGKGGLAKGKRVAALMDPRNGYRTEEQEQALFYFSDKNKQGCFTRMKGCFAKKPKSTGSVEKKKGCFPKKRKFVSDADYDAMVNSIVQRLDPKSRGIQKLGIDETQIEKAISFSNYTFGLKNIAENLQGGDLASAANAFNWKIGDDGRFRSSTFEVTYLFLTQSQVLAYQLTLSSDWEKHDEETFEYHYKDITALKTRTLQQDEVKDGTIVYQTVKNEFLIRVPGDSFSVSLSNKPTKEEESAIQGMKSMLREKKA